MAVADRPRLGRGLKAILSVPVQVDAAATPAPAAPQEAAAQPGDRLALIPIDKIDPNPHQPRAAIDPVALESLVASVKQSGVIQAVLVRPAAHGRYQLIAGHRRTEAAKRAGLAAVPAVIRQESTDESQALEALIENIQREDLNPVERAKAYRTVIHDFKLTHAAAAQRLGEDRVTISNFLRILDLPEGVQMLVGRNLLSAGHAKVLAGLNDAARQEALANQAVKDGLSVRKLEELIAATPPPAAPSAETAVAGHTRTLMAKSAHVVELEQDLSRKLGTKVRIFPAKKKNTGKLIIQYFSLDEFDRIVERLDDAKK